MSEHDSDMFHYDQKRIQRFFSMSEFLVETLQKA